MAKTSKESQLSFDITEFKDAMGRLEKKALDASKVAMQDNVDELVRISSEITPIDGGILLKSHSEGVVERNGAYEGFVEYAVKEAQTNGKHFNYALFMHEGEYRLGEESRKRPGTTGRSGKKYDVGNKYLERPLKGERDSFFKHIADMIKNAIED